MWAVIPNVMASLFSVYIFTDVFSSLNYYGINYFFNREESKHFFSEGRLTHLFDFGAEETLNMNDFGNLYTEKCLQNSSATIALPTHISMRCARSSTTDDGIAVLLC